MSSALVRQALELVDNEESGRGNKKRSAVSTRGQGNTSHPYKSAHNTGQKNKFKTKVRKSVCPEDPTEDNIRKLLLLSKSKADKGITEKIVARAVKGKPLLDTIPIQTEDEDKSILFTEQTFKEFEKEFFCS